MLTHWCGPGSSMTDMFTYFNLFIRVPPETLVYQAASPDEEALVGAARELGWVFFSRTRDCITVYELGVARQYQLLALLDFTSQRRRMSVLGESSLINMHHKQVYAYRYTSLVLFNTSQSFLNKPASLVVCFF